MTRSDAATGTYIDTFCVESAEAAPTVTPAMVLAEFRAVPLPESAIVVQPPGGLTMVNFLTIFHTVAEAFTRDLTLVGQSVRLEITPTSYTWDHGDGTSQTTSSPGRPFAEGVAESAYVGHRYPRAADAVPVSVDTTWSARFSVNGGPWIAIAETVTMAGEPFALEVREATPVLVD